MSGHSDLLTSTVLAAVISAVIAGIFSIVVKILGDKKVKELEHKLKLSEEYDKDLRIKRIESYKAIWKIMRPLSKKNNDLIYPYQLDDLIKKMTDWYYNLDNSNHGGGFFLTEFGQKQYIEFISNIIHIRDEYRGQIPTNEDKWERDVNNIKERASQLRTFLCKDAVVRETSENSSYYDDLRIDVGGCSKPEETLEFKVHNCGFITLRYSYYPTLFIVNSNSGSNFSSGPIKAEFKKTSEDYIKKTIGKSGILKPGKDLTFILKKKDIAAGNAGSKWFAIINLDGIRHPRFFNKGIYSRN